jgi:hypothetical protein
MPVNQWWGVASRDGPASETPQPRGGFVLSRAGSRADDCAPNEGGVHLGGRLAAESICTGIGSVRNLFTVCVAMQRSGSD